LPRAKGSHLNTAKTSSRHKSSSETQNKTQRPPLLGTESNQEITPKKHLLYNGTTIIIRDRQEKPMGTACIFSLDNSYELPFKVFFHTLNETSSIPIEVEIFILHTDSLAEEAMGRIQSFINGYGREAFFLNVKEYIPSDLPLAPGDHVSSATFYRLFIGEILPKRIETAIYLDSDMVAIRSIAPLFSIRLDQSLIAAVDHCSPRDQLRLWGEKGGTYFQAGVLVIPTDKWRSQNLSRIFIHNMQKNKQSICWWDQDILNISLRGKWRRLPIWMNVCRELQMTIPEEMINKDACLIHYSGQNKPWNSRSWLMHDKHWLKAYKRLHGKEFHAADVTKDRLIPLIKALIITILKPFRQFLISPKTKFKWTNLK
jgi:lipopolysaccharide biosynthesis glycosyltransferase